MTPSGTYKRARYQGPTAWLGLCAVLFLQVQIAGHTQLEHASSGSHEDMCEVCLKFDKSGDVPLTATTTFVIELAADTPGFASTPDAFTRASNPHTARGPPIC